MKPRTNTALPPARKHRAAKPLPSDYRTIPEVCRSLGVSDDTIRRAIAAGKLTAVRLGHRTVRVRDADLRLYLARFQVPKPRAKRGRGGK